MTAISGVFVLAINCAWATDEKNCNNWGSPSADPTKGRYAIELRTCELTYGLSAYIEIRNKSETRLVLAYRIVTGDDKYKDGDVVLEAGVITRAGNCQACAKRHVGFKSWELISASEAPADEGTATAVKPAALPAFMETPAAAKKPVVEAPAKPVTAKPAAEPVTEKPAPAPAATIPASAATPAPTPTPTPVTEQPKPVPEIKTEVEKPATEPEQKKEVDGFRADDGTIIPWDQMPPEFRPRK